MLQLKKCRSTQLGHYWKLSKKTYSRVKILQIYGSVSFFLYGNRSENYCLSSADRQCGQMNQKRAHLCDYFGDLEGKIWNIRWLMFKAWKPLAVGNNNNPPGLRLGSCALDMWADLSQSHSVIIFPQPSLHFHSFIPLINSKLWF